MKLNPHLPAIVCKITTKYTLDDPHGQISKLDSVLHGRQYRVSVPKKVDGSVPMSRARIRRSTGYRRYFEHTGRAILLWRAFLSETYEGIVWGVGTIFVAD